MRRCNQDSKGSGAHLACKPGRRRLPFTLPDSQRNQHCDNPGHEHHGGAEFPGLTRQQGNDDGSPVHHGRWIDPRVLQRAYRPYHLEVVHCSLDTNHCQRYRSHSRACSCHSGQLPPSSLHEKQHREQGGVLRLEPQQAQQHSTQERPPGPQRSQGKDERQQQQAVGLPLEQGVGHSDEAEHHHRRGTSQRLPPEGQGNRCHEGRQADARPHHVCPGDGKQCQWQIEQRQKGGIWVGVEAGIPSDELRGGQAMAEVQLEGVLPVHVKEARARSITDQRSCRPVGAEVDVEEDVRPGPDPEVGGVQQHDNPRGSHRHSDTAIQPIQS